MNEARIMLKDLQRLRTNKGAMVALKRSLSTALVHKAWPYLAQYGWCDLNDERKRTITQHVAAFYAIHPKHVPGTNFGNSLRLMAIKRSEGTSIKAALELNEKYLKRIISCRDSEGACERLSFVMRMIKNFDSHVDYERLYSDLCYWGEPVKIQWAYAYYTKKGDEKNVPNQDNG